MPPAIRLALAILSGLAGLSAILLTFRPGVVSSQQAWLLGSITVLVAATLVVTVADAMAARTDSATPDAVPAASGADREIHGEVAKIVGLLQKQVEANATFSTALTKAQDQLPEALKPDQVKLVVSYLMIENENMRSRTAELQGDLEKSQRQIERLKSNLAAAEAQGLSDPLTGLKNRRSFDITLAAEIAATRTSSQPLCLIMADIDHFKSINDRYGHPAGDDVLKWFSRILQNNMKGRDTVARYGGEEFAIILPQTALDNAVNLASQIRRQLESTLWKKPGAPNTMLRITASFGVAKLADGEGTSGIIQRADAKLYESKSTGRNRVAA
jgi:diguanylate cyclase